MIMIFLYVFLPWRERDNNKSMELLDYCKNFRRIYIYGDGEVGRLVRIFLYENGVEVECFVTSGKPRHSVVLELPVCQLEQIFGRDNSECFIICVNGKYIDVIKNNLLRKGFDKFFVVDNLMKYELYDSTNFEHDYIDVHQGNRLSVLLYHRIVRMNDPYNIVVSKENFESHLIYIRENYNIIRCNDPLRAVNRNTVAITFDDGYIDFYTNAYPLLIKYQIPATIFISTGNIGKEKEFWWDELEYIIFEEKLPEHLDVFGRKIYTKEYQTRKELLLSVRQIIIDNNCKDRDRGMNDLWKQIGKNRIFRENNRTMNESEIAEIANNPLITIGAHTVSHVICSKESNDDLVDQIKESKNYLENITKKEVDLFSYPNGDFDSVSVDILKRLGFKRAFTCVHACVSDENKDYVIPRYGVLDWGGENVRKGFRSIWMTDRGYY